MGDNVGFERTVTMHARRRSGQSAISERQLQDAVVEIAMVRGWRVCHFRAAQNSRGEWATHLQGHPGFVDLVLARKGVVLYVELKSETGKLTRDQEEWAAALGSAQVWRPEQLRDGTVAKRLM